MSVIDVQGLTKSFISNVKQPGFLGTMKSLIRPDKKTTDAVKDISFQIDQGEIVGFLGPNGAGKTTTIKMLTGILFPTGGEARVLGYKPFDRHPEMLRQIALVMGNRQQLWWDLPAWDSFVVLRELYDIDSALFKTRLDRLVEALGLGDHLHTQVRKLSLGERMKCELVAALLHSPRVIFLDEPTIGLDVVSQRRIRKFLQDVNAEEKCSIVLTSHYMQDVEELCERVIIIDHGKLVYDGTLSRLTAESGDVRKLQFTFQTSVPRQELEAYGPIADWSEDSVTFDLPHDQVAVVTAELLAKHPIVDISVSDVDVEDVITRLFSRTL